MNEFRIGFMGEYDLFSPATLGKGYPAKIGLKFSKADNFPTDQHLQLLRPGRRPPCQLQREQYRHLRPDDAHQGAPPPPLRRRGGYLPRRFHGMGQHLTARTSALPASTPRAATTGVARLDKSGVAYADFLLGYAQSWSASVSPEYGGTAEESRRVRPGRLQSEPEAHPESRPAVGGEHGMVRDRRECALLRPERDQSRHQCSRRDVVRHHGCEWQERRCRRPVWNNWLPRFGFAYLLGNKTTIRGGFGMYTFPWNVDTYASAGLGNAFTAAATRQTPPTTCNRW